MSGLMKAALAALTLVTLAGCMQHSDAVGSDGRPHAPSKQSGPGASEGEGPVGQPQD